MRTGRGLEAGAAYVLLLLAVALIGLAAAASISLGAAIGRRDAEQHLLAVGLEYQRALRSYAGLAAGPNAPGVGRGPHELDDLLKDPRIPGTRRHLRRIHADPLTGKTEWGLVRDSQGAIVGLYSVAEGVPIQRAGFEAALAGFEEASSYRGWVFGLPGVQARHPSAGSGADVNQMRASANSGAASDR